MITFQVSLASTDLCESEDSITLMDLNTNDSWLLPCPCSCDGPIVTRQLLRTTQGESYGPTWSTHESCCMTHPGAPSAEPRLLIFVWDCAGQTLFHEFITSSVSSRMDVYTILHPLSRRIFHSWAQSRGVPIFFCCQPTMCSSLAVRCSLLVDLYDPGWIFNTVTLFESHQCNLQNTWTTFNEFHLNVCHCANLKLFLNNWTCIARIKQLKTFKLYDQLVLYECFQQYNNI